MERWERIVFDVNAICANLVGNVCSCLVYILLSGRDATSYPYDKGMLTVLNNLIVRDYPGLDNVLGEGSIKLANMQQNPSELLYMISCDRPSWSLLASR